MNVGVFKKQWLSVLFFVAASLQAAESDDPCLVCRDFLMPVAQTLLTQTVWVIGTWAASKVVLKEYRKGRLPGQQEQPKKSDLLAKRVEDLEKENEVLARSVVCLVAAGAETEQHKRIVRQLLSYKPGTKRILVHARDEDAQAIKKVLEAR